MYFQWTTTAWKALRPLLTALLVSAVAGAIEAVQGGALPTSAEDLKVVAGIMVGGAVIGAQAGWRNYSNNKYRPRVR